MQNKDSHFIQEVRVNHLTGVDGKTTLCGIAITKDISVDSHMDDSIHTESLIICPACKRIQQPEPIDALVVELNRLTARGRAFKLLKVEIDDHSRREVQFNPKQVLKKTIINAVRLVSLGANRFNFDESARTGAPSVCVFSRESGRCHGCLRARSGCLHPKGPRISPYGAAKMRERGY